MSVIVSAKAIAKFYGDDTLFTDLTFEVTSGQKLGLIGMNGSGKSTLLRILSGLALPDEGEVVVKTGERLVYLPQEDELDPDLSIEATLHAALKPLPMDEKERLRRVNQALGRGGFQDPSARVGQLSGGWRKRLAITRTLCLAPDLLLLDEPTNHLDITGILWLETLLKSARHPFILVSHDRAFLETVCTHTMEIARYFDQGHFQIQGQYRLFEQEREKYLDAQVKRQASLASKMRREDEWLRQGAKARTTKAKYRIEQAMALRKELAQVRERNQKTAKLDLDFSGTGRQTRKLLQVHNLAKGFGSCPLFSGITFELGPKFCLGVVGENGSGKSTFLSLLEKSLEPDQGTVKWAEGLQIGVFAQNRSALDPEVTLREALNPAGGDSVNFKGRPLHLVSWAKRFLFMPDQLDMPVKRLSGGEKARIVLANLMRQPCDVLLLDEPTNDLDILSLEVLEESIKEFPGAVVIVSHDRFLMDRVCHRILYLEKDQEPAFFKDFSQIMATRAQRQAAKEASEPKAPKAMPKKKSPGRSGLTYKDQFELDQIEEKILAAEALAAELTIKVQAPEVICDSARLTETCTLLEQAEGQVQALYARWEELEEKKAEAQKD